MEGEGDSIRHNTNGPTIEQKNKTNKPSGKMQENGEVVGKYI